MQNSPSPPSPSDLSHLSDWIGRSESRTDLIAATPVAALSATLDRADPAPTTGIALPPLWHWLYFTPLTRHSELGEDGHAKRGGFLPPVPLPRRMWAGGRLEFLQPLRVDETVTRTSTIKDVTIKQGRSGSLVFVCVKHDFSTLQGLALREEHDIVYRDAPLPGAPAPDPTPAPRDEQFSREVVPDPVLLFRYSALTFNGHRIHYDRSYVTGVEGYPGLIVHGPLIATLLVDLLRRNLPNAQVKRFNFKAVRPTFDIHPFSVCGKVEPAQAGAPRTVTLWGRDHEGWLTMQATAEIE
jgi:3-methylfumaryl-CoA hydratase